MKKFILYVLATIGGFMIGCIIGGLCLPIFLLLIAPFTGGFPELGQANAIMSMRVVGIIGAIVLPVLLREKISQWLDG